MKKLFWRPIDDWIPHSHAPCFAFERLTQGSSRLIVGVSNDGARILRELSECLQPPSSILYVLHTPRGEALPGRYQSPELDLLQVRDFLARFAALVDGDARFDLWIHSPSSAGTLVLDRHDLLYLYGPIDCFLRVLGSLGYCEGLVSIPMPHQHHYRSELDELSRTIMSVYDWRYSPLRPEDEQ